MTDGDELVISWAPHAQRRARKRGVSRRQAEELIRQSAATEPLEAGERVTISGVEGSVVVCHTAPGIVIVITVFKRARAADMFPASRSSRRARVRFQAWHSEEE